MDRNKPRVLAVIDHFSPSAVIYITRPLSVLASRGLIDFQVVFEMDMKASLVRAADVLVFCRNQNPAGLQFLRLAKSLEKAIIYNLDDSLWEVPAHLPYSGLYTAPDKVAALEEHIRTASLVRVYSARLLELVSQMTTRVERVRPGIDLTLTQSVQPEQNRGRLCITYVTGRGNQDELYTLFLPDLARALNEFPDRLEAAFWGEIPDHLTGHPNVSAVPIYHDYTEYLKVLSSGRFDIGLAPLTPTPFNLAKNDTKFRDYGACRIAGIYSNVAVYEKVADGVTGILVGTEEGAWYRAIRQLVEDHRLRTTIIESAYQFIYDYYRQELLEDQWIKDLNQLLDRDLCAEATTQPAPAEDDDLTQELYSDLASTIGVLRDHLTANETKINQLSADLVNSQALAQAYQSSAIKGREAIQRFSKIRSNRFVDLIWSRYSRYDAWADVTKDFNQFKDDVVLFQGPIDGYRLQPSADLSIVPFISYRFKLRKPGLCGLAFAPILELPLLSGVVGLELVAPNKAIFAQVIHPASKANESGPLKFDFSPIVEAFEGTWELRVFGRELDIPFKIYEFRKPVAGIGPILRKAFCSFHFSR